MSFTVLPPYCIRTVGPTGGDAFCVALLLVSKLAQFAWVAILFDKSLDSNERRIASFAACQCRAGAERLGTACVRSRTPNRASIHFRSVRQRQRPTVYAAARARAGARVGRTNIPRLRACPGPRAGARWPLRGVACSRTSVGAHARNGAMSISAGVCQMACDGAGTCRSHNSSTNSRGLNPAQ